MCLLTDQQTDRHTDTNAEIYYIDTDTVMIFQLKFRHHNLAHLDHFIAIENPSSEMVNKAYASS